MSSRDLWFLGRVAAVLTIVVLGAYGVSKYAARDCAARGGQYATVTTASDGAYRVSAKCVTDAP